MSQTTQRLNSATRRPSKKGTVAPSSAGAIVCRGWFRNQSPERVYDECRSKGIDYLTKDKIAELFVLLEPFRQAVVEADAVQQQSDSCRDRAQSCRDRSFGCL